MTVATCMRRSLTMGIHPTSRGFGWIVFEGPFAPYDWGTPNTHGDKNVVCLRRVEQLLSRYQPDTLVLEVFEGRASMRAARICRLGRSLAALATSKGINVEILNRADVKAAFQSVGASTRHEIAEAVAVHVEALRPRLPRRRQPWDSERLGTALFSAAALVIAHYQMGANDLFEDLKDGL